MWAFRSITMNKTSGGYRITAELFKILKDVVTNVLYKIRQQIWKTQQYPQDRKRLVFIPIPKKVKVKVAQSCPTLQPMDYTVHGIL